MPNRHETLVIKLISIGISHDLSFLEQVKYTKENNAMKWSEEDFIACYRKMFMALLTLGFIIKDYTLRRLCIQSASVCEPHTKLCEEILTFLPDAASTTADDNSELKEVLSQLREQLETFKSAIKMKISLPSTWNKASLNCYENLEFFNRRIQLSEELEPLKYPGVEKYLKRPRVYSTDEVEVVEKPALDAKQVLKESKEFAADISSRFRRIKYPLAPTSGIPIPFPTEITAKIINTLQTSPCFEFENSKIFMRLSEDLSLESSSKYHIKWYWIDKERLKMNKGQLFFDFNMEPRDVVDSNVGTIYQSGVVRVYDLCQRSFTIFEIENVMLYTIMDKKRYFIHQEFVDFNQNKQLSETSEQSQHAFNYLLCRAIPEHARLLKIQNIGLTSANAYEYCLEKYTFDARPGRYRYTKKTQDAEPGENLNISLEATKEKVVKAPRSTQSKASVRKPGPACATMTKKAERAQAGFIEPTETFHASEEMMGIFALLENELSKAAGAKVSINLKQLSDESSPHKVNLTYNASTLFTVKLLKSRNHHACTTTSLEFELPARIHGSLTIESEWNDSIVYDENFDNPSVKSVEVKRQISGNITFDHVTINVKNIDLECDLGGFKNSLKLGLRMGSRSRSKYESFKNTRDANKGLSDSSGILSPKPSRSNKLAKTSSFVKAEPNSQEYDSPGVGSSQNIEIYQANHQTQVQVQANYVTQTSSPGYSNNFSLLESQLPNYDQHNGSAGIIVPDISCDVHASFTQSQQNNSFQHTNGAFDTSIQESEMKEFVSDRAHFATSNQELQQAGNDESELMQIETSLPLIKPSAIKAVPELMNYQMTSIPLLTASEIKSESVYEEEEVQLDVLASIQNFPEVSIQIIPKAEKCKILKVENVSPNKLLVNKSNGHFNGFDDISSTENQIVPVNGFNGLGIERKHPHSAAPVGGTLDDFEELLTGSVHMVKTRVPTVTTRRRSPKVKAQNHEQTPPKSPPPLHHFLGNMPEVFNRRALDERRKSIELKQENIDLSADRIMSHTPPEDIIDLTDEKEGQYQVKRVKPCPRSKKQQHTNVIEYDMFGVSFCEAPNGEDQQRNLKEQYSKVMKMVEAKKVFPERIHGDVEANAITDDDDVETKDCKVHLYNVMKHFDSNNPKRNISVNVEEMKVKFKPNVSFDIQQF